MVRELPARNVICSPAEMVESVEGPEYLGRRRGDQRKWESDPEPNNSIQKGQPEILRSVEKGPKVAGIIFGRASEIEVFSTSESDDEVQPRTLNERSSTKKHCG